MSEGIVHLLKKYLSEILYVITLSTLFIFLLLQGPQFTNDSYSYLDMSPHRSAGYSFFLYLFRIFGDYQLIAVIIAQCILYVSSLTVFIHYIHKTLQLSKYTSLVLLPFVMTFFLLSNNYYPITIVSEGIAVPLFLILSIYLIESLLKRSYKTLFITFLIGAVLVLIRGQFLFIYPVFVLILAYFWWMNKNLSSLIKYTTLLIILFLSHNIVDRSYHYLVHGKFTSTPGTNLSLATNAIYMSQRSDVELFATSEDSALFAEIYEEAYQKNALRSSYKDRLATTPEGERSDGLTSRTRHYSLQFNELIHQTIIPVLSNKFQEIEGIEQWELFDRKGRELTLTLTKKRWKEIYQNNLLDIVISGFRSYIGFLLFILLLGTSTYGAIRYGNKPALILSLFTVIHLVNLLLVSIAGRVIPRYFIYTEFVIVVVICSLVIRTILKEK